jgi:hypothetical protein
MGKKGLEMYDAVSVSATADSKIVSKEEQFSLPIWRCPASRAKQYFHIAS